MTKYPDFDLRPPSQDLSEIDRQSLHRLLDRNGRGTIISVIHIWWLFFFQFAWLLPCFAFAYSKGPMETILRIPWTINVFIIVAYPFFRYIIYPMQCAYMSMDGTYCVERRKATPGDVRQVLNVAGNRKEMERFFLAQPAKPFYFLAHCYVRGGGDDGITMILQLEDKKISKWGWNFFFWQDAIKGASLAWALGSIQFFHYYNFPPEQNLLLDIFYALFERPFHYLWEALHFRFSLATLASFHVLLVEAIILLGWGSLLYEFWLRRTRNFAMPEGYLLLPQPKRIPEPKFIVLCPPKKPKVKSPEDDEPPPAPFFPKPKRQRTKKPEPADATTESPASEPPPSAPIPPDQWKNWE